MTKVYLKNPFDYLYQIDEEIIESVPNHLKDLIQFGHDLEEQIAGDLEESFGHLIYQFQSDRFAFVRRGLIGSKIKFYRLYKRLDYKRFNSFTEEVFGKSSWQINREINAARVVFALLSAGFDILPTCTAQAEVMRNFGMEDLIENWQQVVDNILPHEITAPAIRQLLFAPTENDRAMKQVKLPALDFEKIWNQAREMCCSTPELISKAVNFFVENSPVNNEPSVSKGISSLIDRSLGQIFSAFLHHFETLLYTLNPSLKQAIWEKDLADLTSNPNCC